MVSKVIVGTEHKKELKLYLLHVSGLQRKQKIKMDIPIDIAVTLQLPLCSGSQGESINVSG